MVSISSFKLFYSQRLGRFSDYDPTPTLIVLLLIQLLIIGPLSSTIMMAYFSQYFPVLFIMLTMVVNLAVTFIFRRKAIRDLCYERGKPLFTVQRRMMALKNINAKFIKSIFTSWIAPCTVWQNNFEVRSNFLIVSSLASTLCHIMGLMVSFLAWRHSTLKCPPSLNCIEAGNQSMR